MTEPDVTIRQLMPTDIETFQRIRLEALRLEPSSFASSHEDWKAFSEDEWRQRLNDPVFVAFVDAEPVGMMGLLRQRGRKMAHRATVIMVYVRQDQRGTGLAVGLLKAISAHARAAGVRQLELTVSAENPAAKRFYAREGFAEVGRIPGGVIEDGREVDDILMARRLV